MRRFGVVSVLVVVSAVFALSRGFREGDGADRPVSTASRPDASATSRVGVNANPRDAEGNPGDPVWVAIDFVELEHGGGAEYFGRVDRLALDALIEGRLTGYLRLDQVFWMYDDGEVDRLDDDIAYGTSAFFRVEAIRRITPVKDGFPEVARQLRPGDRIVPSSGRDA